VAELVGYLVRAAGHGANLLLNVGPRPDGTLVPEQVERLRGVGRWLETYGPSIYGTRAGPVPPRSWGATTRRGDTVFVHVLDWPDQTLALPAPGSRILEATRLDSGAPVPFDQTDEGLVLTLPAPEPGEVDRVIRLRLAGR
jgi:alpha-L-fucosidase